MLRIVGHPQVEPDNISSYNNALDMTLDTSRQTPTQTLSIAGVLAKFIP